MTIEVTREVYKTPWTIKLQLDWLNGWDKLSFDVETSGLYSKEQRREAMKLTEEGLKTEMHKLVSVVANNSGLSFPSITKTTHFIFGISKSHSVILVPPDANSELFIWNWLSKYQGTLLIHNTLFDLKIMYNRIKKLPVDYEDTMLMLKTLINNSDVWKAKTGLKDVMDGYYDPAWSLYDQYEPENPMDLNFLDYAAIDGAATYHLHELIMEKYPCT